MKVYGEYTQDQLDAQYNLRARHPDHHEHFARWSRASADARSSVPCQSDIRYGDGDKQSLDLFRATASSGPRPLLAFIHGGYWQAMDKSDFGFLAPSFTRKGITLAMPQRWPAKVVTSANIHGPRKAVLLPEKA